MLENRISTYYLLLVDKGDFNDELNLSKDKIRLPNVVIAHMVIITHIHFKEDVMRCLKLTKMEFLIDRRTLNFAYKTSKV